MAAESTHPRATSDSRPPVSSRQRMRGVGYNSARQHGHRTLLIPNRAFRIVKTLIQSPCPHCHRPFALEDIAFEITGYFPHLTEVGALQLVEEIERGEVTSGYGPNPQGRNPSIENALKVMPVKCRTDYMTVDFDA